MHTDAGWIAWAWKGNQHSHNVGATVETSKKIIVSELARMHSYSEGMLILNPNGGMRFIYTFSSSLTRLGWLIWLMGS